MNHIKPDRRAERTRYALGQALAALLSEKTYAAISVKAIMDRANVGRTTFYEYFCDRHELLARKVYRGSTSSRSKRCRPAGLLTRSFPVWASFASSWNGG